MASICFGAVRLTSSPCRLGSERKDHMSKNLGGPSAVDKSTAKNLNISEWSDAAGLAGSDEHSALECGVSIALQKALQPH